MQFVLTWLKIVTVTFYVIAFSAILVSGSLGATAFQEALLVPVLISVALMGILFLIGPLAADLWALRPPKPPPRPPGDYPDDPLSLPRLRPRSA